MAVHQLVNHKVVQKCEKIRIDARLNDYKPASLILRYFYAQRTLKCWGSIHFTTGYLDVYHAFLPPRALFLKVIVVSSNFVAGYYMDQVVRQAWNRSLGVLHSK